MRRNHETCVEADYKITGWVSCAAAILRRFSSIRNGLWLWGRRRPARARGSLALSLRAPAVLVDRRSREASDQSESPLPTVMAGLGSGAAARQDAPGPRAARTQDHRAGRCAHRPSPARRGDLLDRRHDGQGGAEQRLLGAADLSRRAMVADLTVPAPQLRHSRRSALPTKLEERIVSVATLVIRGCPLRSRRYGGAALGG